MTQPNHFLSPSGQRAVAAAALTAADPTVPLEVAGAALDVLDAISAATLSAVAVLSPPAQRTVLSLLWGDQR